MKISKQQLKEMVQKEVQKSLNEVDTNTEISPGLTFDQRDFDRSADEAFNAVWDLLKKVDELLEEAKYIADMNQVTKHAKYGQVHALRNNLRSTLKMIRQALYS